MNNEKATLLAVSVAVAALVGAIFGGTTALLINSSGNYIAGLTGQQSGDETNIGDDSKVDQAIVKLIEEETATIRVVEQITPAVVSVVAKREYGGELVEVSGGTGFFVTASGLILTNRHVVGSESENVFSIMTNSGEEYPVEIVAKDTINDLAVLQVVASADIELPEFATVKLGDSDSVKNGQTVIAIGNALSEYQNSVTKGVVSGTGRRVVAGDWTYSEVIEEAIQTDAAINFGNSGGPLINLLGEVIGVNTAVSTTGESLGFAIPINAAVKIIDDVVAYGRIIRPWLGVRYIMLDKEIAQQNDLSVDYGALVLSGRGSNDVAVIVGSPAEKAGIKEGDIIVEIDGVRIDSENTLADQVNFYEPSETINIRIIRQPSKEEIDEFVVEATLTELDPSIFE